MNARKPRLIVVSSFLAFFLPANGQGLSVQLDSRAQAPQTVVQTANALRKSIFDPRAFGAVGDGASHTAQTTIKASTLAQLAAFTLNGKHPYSFVARYPYGVLFNLKIERPSSAGSSILDFQTTGFVAVQIPTIHSVKPGDQTIRVGDISVTSDRTSVAQGTPVSCSADAALQHVATVPVGTPGSYEFKLDVPTKSFVPNGALCTFLVSPPKGSYSLPLVHRFGVNRGDFVTGVGIQSGTQVDWVNHAKMEIVLSLPTTARITAGEILVFTPSWLSRVSIGMNVLGPTDAVPAGETVASVDESKGEVKLTKPLTNAVFPDTAMIGVPKEAQTYATAITFYRPYADGEVAKLQMDRLGIQAAVNAATAAGGGAVELPEGGPWLIDGPLVMPIFSPAGINQATVAFGGVAFAENGSTLLATTDFGPGTALISCGDPTAKSNSNRGLYSKPNSLICTGSLHDLRLRPRTPVDAVVGLRPKWNGEPVAMDGVKEGPRLKWERVSISGFDSGALAAFDHTRISDSRLVENFIGLRLDDEQTDFHGDEVFDRLYSTNNMWAAVSVSPKAYLNGELRKAYLSNSPYSIYCEPGPNAKQCIQGTTILDANEENIGCGVIKDGGIRDGFVAGGGTRSIEDLVEINVFAMGRAGFGEGNVPRPAGGCTWTAYFDVGYVIGWRIDNVWTNDFAPVKDSAAHILRTRRIGGTSPMGEGGFRMSGGGVWNAIQNAERYGQNLVTGPAGSEGEFWHSSSWQYVTLEGATFKARPMPFADKDASGLPLGTLLEYGSQEADDTLVTRRASSVGAIAGTSCQNFSQNPSVVHLVPVVCFGGSRLPLLTTSRAKAGQTFTPNNSVVGSAMPAEGVAPVAAVSLSAGVTDRLTYAKPLWTGQQ